MIAMQYSFRLPADYNMDIIDSRIRDKGPMLDDFPDLAFKAYLVARQSQPDVPSDGTGSRDNLYAPFYLWSHPRGMENFLCGPGFAALAASFGRPKVTSWIPWAATAASDIRRATFATRQCSFIGADESLDDLRQSAIRQHQNLLDAGAIAVVCGFDPAEWGRVQFALWPDHPPARWKDDRETQTYRVGHVSYPGI